MVIAHHDGQGDSLDLRLACHALHVLDQAEENVAKVVRPIEADDGLQLLRAGSICIWIVELMGVAIDQRLEHDGEGPLSAISLLGPDETEALLLARDDL